MELCSRIPSLQKPSQISSPTNAHSDDIESILSHRSPAEPTLVTAPAAGNEVTWDPFVSDSMSSTHAQAVGASSSPSTSGPLAFQLDDFFDLVAPSDTTQSKQAVVASGSDLDIFEQPSSITSSVVNSGSSLDQVSFEQQKEIDGLRRQVEILNQELAKASQDLLAAKKSNENVCGNDGHVFQQLRTPDANDDRIMQLEHELTAHLRASDAATQRTKHLELQLAVQLQSSEETTRRTEHLELQLALQVQASEEATCRAEQLKQQLSAQLQVSEIDKQLSFQLESQLKKEAERTEEYKQRSEQYEQELGRLIKMQSVVLDADNAEKVALTSNPSETDSQNARLVQELALAQLAAGELQEKLNAVRIFHPSEIPNFFIFYLHFSQVAVTSRRHTLLAGIQD
jgi:hypothetical protein